MADTLDRQRPLECEVAGCAQTAPASMGIKRLPEGGPRVEPVMSERVFLCLEHFHELLGRTAMQRLQRAS